MCCRPISGSTGWRIINTIQSIITASLILLAFIFKRSLLDVLGAYLVGKSFAGIAVADPGSSADEPEPWVRAGGVALCER